MTCYSPIHVGHKYWPSFIQNFLQLPFATGVLSYNVLCVWRTPGKRSETIPPFRISPDPSYSRVHIDTLLFSFQQGSGQGTRTARTFILCSVLILIFVLDHCPYPTMAYFKISSRGYQVQIFFLSVGIWPQKPVLF